SGLVYLRDHDKDLSRARSRFRGRLMVPIRDVQGRVIAFTARVTDMTPKDDPSHEAKYINSPEIPIFIKSHVLFGLERARKELKDGDSLILVEGQLDCLRCWQAGIRNAVAPQGTAITNNQLSLARRYTGHLECLLDGDSAGQKAALRMLPLALAAGLEVEFLCLPKGQDPDDLLREGGSEALNGLRESALSAMGFAVQALIPEPSQAGARDKAEALDKLYTILRECDSAVAQDAYLAEISRLVQVEPGAVRKDFAAMRGEKARPNPIQIVQPRAKNGNNQKLTCVEGDLLSLILQFPSLGPKISQVIDFEWINGDPQEGALLARLLSACEDGAWEGLENIDDLVENDEEKNYIYRLLADTPKVEEHTDAANDCLRRLMSRYLIERKKTLETAILNETDTERRQALFNERLHLRQLQSNPPQLD
ncbi:MAG: toprim domain-containing protein, partial [Puniceicoccales bacterium]